MVPINVSSHDLQENHFANRKLDNVTATNSFYTFFHRQIFWSFKSADILLTLADC